MTPTDRAHSMMRATLERKIEAWLDDETSAVEYAEEVEGRWAVRVRQLTREATTVWFTIGQRSLQVEAYLMPADGGGVELYRQALARNLRGWRVFFSLDGEDGLVLRGRLPGHSVTDSELDLVLGEIYDTVESAFRPLLRALQQARENSG